MKEKRAKGLPVYPGSTFHYFMLTGLIIVEALAIIAGAYFLALSITALFERTPIGEVLPMIGLFFVVFVLRYFITFLEEKVATRFATRTARTLRNELFETYFSQSQSISQQKGTGSLITLAVEGIEQIERYLEIIGVRTIKSMIIPLAIVIYVFQFDPISAIILIITVPIVIIFMILLGLAAEKLADKQYATYKRLSNHFIDSLKGLETLMYLGKSREHAHNISQVSNEYRRATMRTLRVAFLSSFALDFFSSLSIAFVAVGLGLRLIDGTVMLLPALTILILAPEYFSPIKQVGKDYHATLDGQVAMADMNHILKETARNSKQNNHLLLDELEQIQTIRFEDVAISTGQETIVRNIDGNVERGFIGIVGASGAGKSTFIHFLAGRNEKKAGDIFVNGKPLSSFSDENWYQQVAYIPQHPYIFPISLVDNIRFYAPETSEERVIEIINKLGLAELVATFPNGIHENIGEGHRALSGGQEQRIAMARALVSDKPIILLDEPTAHLDIETEYEIKELMLTLFRDKFVFLATHRLHWMNEMDHIFVLEAGELVEMGTHTQLMANEKAYYRLIHWKEGEHD